MSSLSNRQKMTPMCRPVQEPTYFAEMDSPVGKLLITGSKSKVSGLYVIGGRFVPAIQPEWIRHVECFENAINQLGEYFSGRRREFDFSLEIVGGTEFQRQVWQGLLEVPFGKTLSYSELARKIGKSGASRAVGSANSRNRISIVIPCHRVIGARGDLSGYAGGLHVKNWLIEHESKR